MRTRSHYAGPTGSYYTPGLSSSVSDVRLTGHSAIREIVDSWLINDEGHRKMIMNDMDLK